MDIDHLKPAIGLIAGARPDLPSVFRIMLQDPFQMADRLPRTFNSLLIRRAISPAANGHSSARALARYYAALVDRGAIPPPHSSYTQPPLGSHKHGDAHTQTTGSSDGGKLFTNGMIHDAFTGTGEYENLAVPGGIFGLGFKRAVSKNGDVIGFGHSGIGGSTGMCSIEHRFAIAVTLNKMNFGTVAAKVIHLVCSELNIPFESDGGRGPAVN
ncbi:hypothetical protein M569_13837 [Genlisea aurea]|uniref:Uncharacterized protein n=1 Tax=Genlisea aurea TaxID=192259 RepID=S8C2E2_9LAMI|nr:hypothetical protein M569_13837 [Genlisea aurea]